MNVILDIHLIKQVMNVNGKDHVILAIKNNEKQRFVFLSWNFANKWEN